MGFRKFFVVGCPRSGTTLLQQALGRHPRVAIPPETSFFTLTGLPRRHRGPHLRRLSEDLGIELPQPPRRLRGGPAARAYYEEVARRYVGRVGKPGVTHFGEKTPEHLSRLGRIRAAFPDARVVCIYRDGRDVALSLRSLPWTSRDLYVNFALWRYCCRLQRRAERSCGLPLHLVRYENLVADPEGQMRAILAFLGLPYDPRVVEAGDDAGVVPPWEYPWKARANQPIRGDRVGVWRQQLSADQVGVLERWGGRDLRALGYELATDGRRPLPWLFRTRVAAKSLVWLACRPRYGEHKSRWLARQASGPEPVARS